MLAADVAGYTRLMEADEVGDPGRLVGQPGKNVIDPTIAEHRGRIVKLTGDGFLAEFATANGERSTCAVAMQTVLVANHADTPEDRRFAFRMGINLGEIVDDAEDIYGRRGEYCSAHRVRWPSRAAFGFRPTFTSKSTKSWIFAHLRIWASRSMKNVSTRSPHISRSP